MLDKFYDLMISMLKVSKDESGAALIEYTVLLGILVVAVIASIGVVGTWVTNKWAALSASLP